MVRMPVLLAELPSEVLGLTMKRLWRRPRCGW
jgi:hypothetical protein